MKPVRLILTVLAVAAAAACSRNPTAPSQTTAPTTASQPAHFDGDGGGYFGSGN